MLSGRQAATTTTIFKVFCLTLVGRPGNRTHETSWSMLGPPYRCLLQSAGSTEGISPLRNSIRSPHPRPQEVHASQGLKVGLYTPTILGGNSHLSWSNDRGAIKDPAHTGTSKGLSQATNRGPIRKFLPKYANVYVTFQRHCLSAGVRTHKVTANGVRNRLPAPRTLTSCIDLYFVYCSTLKGTNTQHIGHMDTFLLNRKNNRNTTSQANRGMG